MTSDGSDLSIAPIEHLTIIAAPGLFVILWASGFIGARLGLPYAEPLTFLFLRMFGAVLLLGTIVRSLAPGGRTATEFWTVAQTGVFMHALYLGGVYISIANGLPAALSALIVGLQPCSHRPSLIAPSASGSSLDSGVGYSSALPAYISWFKTRRRQVGLRRSRG